MEISIRLKSKEILKRIIDIDIQKGELANKIDITYQTLNSLLKAQNINSTQIGTVFKLAHFLGYNSIYDILEVNINGTIINNDSVSSESNSTNSKLQKVSINEEPETPNVFIQNAIGFRRMSDK